MTILEKKIDAIARHLLATGTYAKGAALADLRQLMEGK